VHHTGSALNKGVCVIENKKGQVTLGYVYGWIVSIIAMAVATMFAEGAFSPTYITTACIASSGFLCSNPVLHNGNFTVEIGQATGTNWDNVVLCFVPQGSTPPTGSSCPKGSGYSSTNLGTLESGQTATVTFSNMTASTEGEYESGTIWAIYSTPSGVEDTQMATAMLQAQ